MTNEQKQVKDWMVAFGQETPEKPTIPSLEVRKLRAKLILEEALETIDALGFDIYLLNIAKEDYQQDYKFIRKDDIEFEELQTHESSLVDIADGCEDLKVVTEGTLVACGLIKESKFEKDLIGGFRCIEQSINDPLFNEVMRSNWSKMWTTKEMENYIGTGDNFDASGIIGENKYECEDGRIFEKLKTNPEISNRLWLVKDKDGKVIKSPSYKPANLQPIIDELSK